MNLIFLWMFCKTYIKWEFDLRIFPSSWHILYICVHIMCVFDLCCLQIQILTNVNICSLPSNSLWQQTCHVVACLSMYENEHMSPPNFPAGSCSFFPVKSSVCFQPVSPCDVRLPPLLSRQPQLPVKIPPPVCSWATWLFHKGYWNNSAPRRKWQSVQKSTYATTLHWGLVGLRIMNEILQHCISFQKTRHSAPFEITQDYVLLFYLCQWLRYNPSPHPGVTVFTRSIFTVMLTLIVIWRNNTTVRMRKLSALRSSKSPGTSFVCDKKDPFDLSVTCMRLQS